MEISEIRKKNFIDPDAVNRNGGVQWFITLPRWPEMSRENMQLFIEMLPPAKWAIIVEEEHAVEALGLSPVHYHAIVQLKHSLTKAKFLKIFKEKFPLDWKRVDLDMVRSLQDGYDYLLKETIKIVELGERPKLKKLMPVVPYEQSARFKWCEALTIEELKYGRFLSPKYADYLNEYFEWKMEKEESVGDAELKGWCVIPGRK